MAKKKKKQKTLRGAKWAPIKFRKTKHKQKLGLPKKGEASEFKYRLKSI